MSSTVETIQAYEAGKPLKELERELGIKEAVKLASNENPLGCSPAIKDAVLHHLSQMHRYPESAAPELTEMLAEKYGVSTGNVVIGNGSDDIICLLCHAFLNPGEEALMPLPSFLMYEICVKIAKGNPIMVPLKGFDTDLEALIQGIGPKTRMVFITNPFNPTGGTISRSDFIEFSRRVPADVLIVVDEAYAEFVRDDSVYDSLERPLADDRIITLRTFSKAYGLAGFRVGYGIMDEGVAQILHRIRQPFNVNSLAQVAACAALADGEFLAQSVQCAHDGLDQLVSGLRDMGLSCLPSQSNFLMVDVGRDSKKVFNALLKEGVIARSMKSYGFKNYLRVNAGLPEENQAFLAALKSVLEQDPA
ncbi:MAG: histidinol-phosphate transaminase [Desulfobacterales bacterium]|nr:histidinol-phosphate transaminase [Desulfobacterales bacterium]